MTLARATEHGIVILFLTVVTAALLYTILRVPFFLRVPGASFFYGTMAPYQEYEHEHASLRAEGADANGAWHSIDLHAYMPVTGGEFAARARLATFRSRGKEALHAAAQDLLRQVLTHERDAGRLWRRVRLSWDVWPVSTEGYFSLRAAPFLSSTVLADVTP